MILKVFTHPKCPQCPAAKELAKKLKGQLTLEFFNTATVDGLAEAAFYQVMATPSLVLIGNQGQVVASWRGEMPSQKELTAKL